MGKPSDVFLTIEGGGSKGRAAIAWDGRIAARFLPAGLNPNDIGPDLLERRLKSLILPLLEVPSAPIGTLRVLAALAGAGWLEPRRRCTKTLKAVLKPHCSRLCLRVTSDAEALLDRCFAKRDGIVLIAGTGSICLGTKRIGKRRVTARAGGRGSYLDGGCGFQLGLGVLEAALKALEGRGERTLMVDLLCRQHGLEIDRIPERFLPVSREQAADLAHIAVGAAAGGDPVARRLVRRAVTDLVDLAQAVAGRLGLVSSFDLAVSGGLFENAYLRSSFKRMLKRRLPSASLTRIADPLACLTKGP